MPSLIIIKNIVRMLLFQFPEWSEDFRDWNREMYIKCTYNGVQLSETEFPKKWLLDGIQIQIRFPFHLKPWHRSKLRSTKKDPMKKKKRDFSFLTILGTEVELPFSRVTRNPFAFFHPILTKLKTKKKKWQNHFFQVLGILNARTKLFINFLKERAKWIIKIFLFINEKIKQFPTLVLLTFQKIVGFKLSQNQNDSTMSKKNPTIYKSNTRINSINWTNSSLKKKKDINAKRKTIIKKMKKMAKEKKRGSLTAERNIISKKASFYAKELALKKNIWQILQKRNPLLA